jgi:hypothetical protein
MEWLLLWIALCIVVGVAANARGRSGGGWFFLALIVSPLIAGLLVLALPRPAARGRTGLSRTCPYCETTTSATAPVCATCGRESVPMTIEDVHKVYDRVTFRNRVLAATILGFVFLVLALAAVGKFVTTGSLIE